MKRFVCNIKAEIFTGYDKLPHGGSVNIPSGYLVVYFQSRMFFMKRKRKRKKNKKPAAANLYGFSSIHAIESNLLSPLQEYLVYWYSSLILY